MSNKFLKSFVEKVITSIDKFIPLFTKLDEILKEDQKYLKNLKKKLERLLLAIDKKLQKA